MFFTFPLKQTFVFPPLRDWMYKDVTLLSFHSMSTMKPPRAQIPFTLPFLPFLRKSRKQSDTVLGRLHQHFNDAGATAKVTVNLERRVCIEQVGVGTSSASCILSFVSVRTDITQQATVNVVRIFAVLQACIKVDTPAGAPARSIVAFDFQRTGTGLCQFRSFFYRQMMSRIQTEQMRLMTVLRFLVFPVVEPFL